MKIQTGLTGYVLHDGWLHKYTCTHVRKLSIDTNSLVVVENSAAHVILHATLQVYNIETMPDPPAARAQMRQPSNHQPYREQPSTDSESHVPVPIRVPQSKKSRRQPSQPQYAQEAYATQAAPTSPLVGTPDIGVCIR